MRDIFKFVEKISKERHENPFLDVIVSFALYFFVIIAVILAFFFIIKVLPWLIKQTEEPIYKLFVGRKKEEETQEVYHHIDKPLKKLEF